MRGRLRLWRSSVRLKEMSKNYTIGPYVPPKFETLEEVQARKKYWLDKLNEEAGEGFEVVSDPEGWDKLFPDTFHFVIVPVKE